MKREIRSISLSNLLPSACCLGFLCVWVHDGMRVFWLHPLMSAVLIAVGLLVGALGIRMLLGDIRGNLQCRLLPPRNAEFLFYIFMTPANCDALVGDLEERYKLIYKKFGRRRANLWYWTQTVTSLGPIVWAWSKKVSMKPVLAVLGWAVAKGLIGHDGWLAALVELLKKVRS